MEDLSQEELAKRAGIERTRLSRYERGYGRLPEEVLDRIVRLLGRASEDEATKGSA
jgi:transcriptional regulator with XRE-family HTH domain